MKRRNTKNSQEVLEILQKEEAAVSHEKIMAQLEGVDRATIYRILNRFHEDGKVHKIVGDDGKQYFALCLNCGESKHVHNHFHFRCVQCNEVVCLDKEISLQMPEGYIAENFNGVISGVCKKCNS
ncbi:Fur family transcriptional regulator, ferric uptake regulator [Lishizhenia tianjinensis]|uniref:Fur family transcriptional regulator, ferric uptake regulator n=1 Tax=Lishizhenia tianjinensis TaxID=477690 RepID=A0A1I6XHD5_9FLAO|nr:transcriptional repressor [Lishizhenia tianjinensis]SFT37517.1 Fur family transcriptional regulator, ferric uptake regulator [Lishizhenia tianjinensis]